MSVVVQNVSKSFATTLAVDDVSFAVQDNSFVSIVGPSGCGKSTLLRLVAGLISPSRGTIFVREKPVDGPVHDVGMVFQAPVLLPWRTTIDNILFVAEMGGHRTARHRGRALELMVLAGLGGFEQSYPH
jgi:NitT/TauT family transport system ATP-binding protein